MMTTMMIISYDNDDDDENKYDDGDDDDDDDDKSDGCIILMSVFHAVSFSYKFKSDSRLSHHTELGRSVVWKINSMGNVEHDNSPYHDSVLKITPEPECCRI